MKKFYFAVALIFLALFTNEIYKQINKISPKSTELSCQREAITFDKLLDKKQINSAIDLLYTGNIIIKSNIEYSQIMESNLQNKLKIQDSDLIFKSEIKKYIKDTSNKNTKLTIDYYIYENDKKDPNKKNENAKKYAGYIGCEFKIGNRLIYKIQTDYKDIDAKDLDKRFACILKSFIHQKKYAN